MALVSTRTLSSFLILTVIDWYFELRASLIRPLTILSLFCTAEMVGLSGVPKVKRHWMWRMVDSSSSCYAP